MIAEFLAAMKAIPKLVDAAEMIANGIGTMNRRQQEVEAKERLDDKNRLVHDFISARSKLRDTEVQRGGGDPGDPPGGVG